MLLIHQPLFVLPFAAATSPAPPAHRVYLPHVAHHPTAPPEHPPVRASWNSPIALTPDDGQIWLVNPDAGSVTVVDTAQQAVLADIATGGEPWALAIAPDSQRVYVLDREGGRLLAIDAQTFALVGTLAVGAEPVGLALSGNGDTAYITASADNRLVLVDTASLRVRQRIATPRRPYALAVDYAPAGETGSERVYITHLLPFPRPDADQRAITDTGHIGQVSVFDPASPPDAALTQIALSPDAQGFPNRMVGIALANGYAYLPQVRSAPALPNDLTTTVFAAVGAIDLAAQQEDRSAHLPLNDQELFGSPVNNPRAAIPSPDGARLYIVLAGSNLLEVVDIADPHTPRLVKFLATGHNPRGFAVSRDGRRGYVLNYLSRSLGIYDLEALELLAEVPVTVETLPPDVLRGKILFHNASQPRLSRFSWVSCASCHVDGGSDSVTWLLADGPRQTPPLWNLRDTGPWHWSAALDELHDVEESIVVLQHGIGLAPGSNTPLLGKPNANRSTDLDALVAYLEQDIRAPVLATTLPERDPTALQRGRRLFRSAGCATCHGGPTWSSSHLPAAPGTLDADGNGMVDAVLHDVGTLNPADVRGSSGFDVPSLLGVGQTAPYLHDGSLPTLEAVLRSGHPTPQRQGGNGLSESDTADLIPFLRAIDSQTPPIYSE